MAKRRSIQTRNYQKKVYNFPSTPSEKKCRDALISLIVNGVLKDKEQYKSKFPKGYYESILKQYSTEHNKDWLHVTLLKNRVRMAVNKRAKALPLTLLTLPLPTITSPSTITTPTSNVPVVSHQPPPPLYNNKGGRPQGTTTANKRKHAVLLVDLMNTITKEASEKKQKEGRLAVGYVSQLIKKHTAASNLQLSTPITPYAIQQRMYKHRIEVPFSVQKGGRSSPLLQIEDTFVKLVIAMSKSPYPLQAPQAIILFNELIKGTCYENKLVEWKNANIPQHTTNYTFDDEESHIGDDGTIGAGYFRGFMKRNSHRLKNTKRYIFNEMIRHFKFGF